MGEERKKMGVICQAGGERVKVSSELSVVSLGFAVVGRLTNNKR
jgi:hypothetical protein